VSQLEFDEEAGEQLEALYRIGDAVRRRRLVRAALAAAPGERILDVGCGPGFYCAELVPEVGPEGSIVGLDSSPAMLALAARRCEGNGNVDLQVADVISLPVADASFDAALCVQVLEYVSDSPKAIAELFRVLRPGGRIVVWDVDWATLSWRSDHPERMTRVLAAWDEHLAHASLPRTLAPAMRSAGFEHVGMNTHSFATAVFDLDSYGAAVVPIIRGFVPGRNGVSDDEAAAWAAEQRELGRRGEFYFACLQCCFTARRPGPASSPAPDR
jgi:ubiquinone/menaquinone biosynthesis C-methylase UbiE